MEFAPFFALSGGEYLSRQYATALLNALRQFSLTLIPEEMNLDGSLYWMMQEPLQGLHHHLVAQAFYLLPLNLLNQYYLGIYIMAVASLLFSAVGGAYDYMPFIALRAASE